ncbi:MAG: hypothetical protein Q9167_007984 [Letrouitia subvulpina]
MNTHPPQLLSIEDVRQRSTDVIQSNVVDAFAEVEEIPPQYQCIAEWFYPRISNVEIGVSYLILPADTWNVDEIVNRLDRNCTEVLNELEFEDFVRKSLGQTDSKVDYLLENLKFFSQQLNDHVTEATRTLGLEAERIYRAVARRLTRRNPLARWAVSSVLARPVEDPIRSLVFILQPLQEVLKSPLVSANHLLRRLFILRLRFKRQFGSTSHVNWMKPLDTDFRFLELVEMGAVNYKQLSDWDLSSRDIFGATDYVRFESLRQAQLYEQHLSTAPWSSKTGAITECFQTSEGFIRQRMLHIISPYVSPRVTVTLQLPRQIQELIIRRREERRANSLINNLEQQRKRLPLEKSNSKFVD